MGFNANPKFNFMDLVPQNQSSPDTTVAAADVVSKSGEGATLFAFRAADVSIPQTPINSRRKSMTFAEKRKALRTRYTVK